MTRVDMSRASMEHKVALTLWISLGIACVLVFLANLRFGSKALFVGFEDDFFYYAKTAQNIALHGRSSFDGSHLTNGYHPLWMLVMVALTYLTDTSSHHTYLLVLVLELTQTFLVIASCVVVNRFCRTFHTSVLAAVFTVLFAVGDFVIVRTGMEVALTLPLVFALYNFRLGPSFSFQKGSQLVLYGFLASLVVLSRLDSFILIVSMTVIDASRSGPTLRQRIRSFLCFSIGLWPLVCYLLVNILVFKTIAPVSATAKQLRWSHVPSLAALNSFRGFIDSRSWPLLGIYILVTFGGLAVASKKQVQSRSAEQMLLIAAMTFAPLQLLAVATLSDWQLWQWYLYPWLISSVVGLVVLADLLNTTSTRMQSAFKVCFGFCVAFLMIHAASIAWNSSPSHNLPYSSGVDIQRFAATHPGVYAMGDRAGVVGYLIQPPLIQTEGLMMDKEFLQNIRQQKPLISVLHAYHVRYYIATRAKHDANGCYEVKEPWQAGPTSPSMHGNICQKPVMEITKGTFVNDIFDMEDFDKLRSM